MCPECNSERTYWLRGAVLEGARACSNCGIIYDDSEVFTEDDVNALKNVYKKIRLSNKKIGSFNNLSK